MTISCDIGADRARDLARVFELVERAILERDREGLQRPVDHPRHQRGDRAAVDAARQEHAERHVAHQPQADRFLEQRPEPLDEVRRFGDSSALGPVSRVGMSQYCRMRDRTAFEDQPMPGQQLVDAAEHRLRRRTCSAC